MKTDLTKGVRKIVLTKSETNAMHLARDVCNELSLVAHEHARTGATQARDGLTEMIRRYCPDAAASEPAAATTKAG